MKRPPFLPKRRRPPDRRIEPEPPPQGPQGRQRNVSERVRRRESGISGFPGFSPSILPPAREGWVAESAVGRPRPRCGSGVGRNGRVQGIFRLAPGKRTGEAGSRKPGARNRLVAADRGLWRSQSARPGPCGTAPSARKGVRWPEPGGMRGHPVWVKNAEAIKTARWDRPKRKWAGGTPMQGKHPAEGFHGYRCKIAPGLRVPGCLPRSGMIGKPADGRGGNG